MALRLEQLRWLRWAQGLAGCGLVAYTVAHIVRHWSAFSGREAWVDSGGSQPASGTLLWVVPLALYAGLGIFVRASDRRPRQGEERDLYFLRLVTAAVALVFVAAHAAHVSVPTAGDHASPHAAYEVLWHSVGKLGILSVYLVGVSAVCLHVALAFDTLCAPPSQALRYRRVVRYVLGIAGFACWGLMLHLLGHFALGDGLVPTGARVHMPMRQDVSPPQFRNR
ncbi:MAG: hypothetical protein OXU20_06805 [Myxococcales bacterium]|nr:hypothetical protein [Myxococcales bacterium]MDD9972278.1 hypothetical protein [Myxococcales bacterium]